MEINNLTGKIIGLAIEVRKALGPGLLESAYCECLAYEYITPVYTLKDKKRFP